MNYIRFAVILFAAIVHNANALNILGLFPHPGVTHFYFFQPILHGLANAGHNVTVVSQFPDPKPPANYKDLSLAGIPTLHDSIDVNHFTTTSKAVHFMEFFLLKEWGLTSCERFLNSTAIAQVLQSTKKFDVILMEQFNNDGMMAVAWKLKAPVIGLSSTPVMPWHYERVGSPDTPSYIPALFLGQSERMTFVNRLGNWITEQAFKLMYKYLINPPTDELVRKYLGNGIPPVDELSKQISLMFINQHYSLSGPQPRSPSAIELMGVHIRDPKPIDDRIQKFLDSAKDGVIFFSWGSMVKPDNMPDEKRREILKVFKSLKQKVLWKWPNSTMPDKPDNVMIHKWLPQREILCHPNVKVFMTHGGSLGAAEVCYCGVPTIVTPFYGDQYYNAAAFANRGVGITVLYPELTAATLGDAIQRALSPEMAKNAKALSYEFRNRPKTPLESAIWWVEHVAATDGAAYLKSHSTYLSGFVYHSFDVYATLLAVFIVTIMIFVLILRKLCCRSQSPSGKSKNKQKRN